MVLCSPDLVLAIDRKGFGAIGGLQGITIRPPLSTPSVNQTMGTLPIVGSNRNSMMTTLTTNSLGSLIQSLGGGRINMHIHLVCGE